MLEKFSRKRERRHKDKNGEAYARDNDAKVSYIILDVPFRTSVRVQPQTYSDDGRSETLIT